MEILRKIGIKENEFNSITNIYKKSTGIIILNDEKLSGTRDSNRNTEDIRKDSRHTDIKNRQSLYSVRSAMAVHREEFCHDLVECHLILPRF